MKKRLFAIFLALCLAASLLPTGVLAASGQISIGGTTYEGAFDNGTISWDGNGTLKLNGADVTNEHPLSPGISYTGDLTIELSGENKVIGLAGIYVNGNLTITGNGSIEATGSMGITASSITVSGGNVEAFGGSSHGIHTTEGLTISGGDVYAETDSGKNAVNGGITFDPPAGSYILCDGVNYYSKRTFFQEDNMFKCYTEVAEDGIEICINDGDGKEVKALTSFRGQTVYATVDDSGNIDDSSASNYNISWNGRTLTLKDAKLAGRIIEGDVYFDVDLRLIGNNSTGEIKVRGNLSISGEDASLTAEDAENYLSDTIYAEGAVTIESGTINVTNSYDEGTAICGSSVTINGGTVTASYAGAAWSDKGVGIGAGGSVTINGGNVTAKGTGSAERIQFNGISAGSVAIKGGTVDVSGDNTTGSGINATGNVSISGGEVTAKAGTNSNGNGINAGGSVTISGGKVTARGNNIAAISADGGVILDPGEGQISVYSSEGGAPDKIYYSSENIGTETEPYFRSEYGSFPEGAETVTVGGVKLVSVGGSEAYAAWSGNEVVTSDADTADIIWDGSKLTLNVFQSSNAEIEREGDLTIEAIGVNYAGSITVSGELTLTVGLMRSDYYYGLLEVNGNTAAAINAGSVWLTIPPSGQHLDVSVGDSPYNTTTTTFAGNAGITELVEDRKVFMLDVYNGDIKGVELDEDSLDLTPGGEATLTAAVDFTGDSADTSVTWSSSNTSVATVDADGNVTAVGPGEATITVTTNVGSYTASCAVTVSGLTAGGVALDGSATLPAYATTDEDGKVTVQADYDEADSWNIKWDGATLTLRGAAISGGIDYYDSEAGSIELVITGENSITASDSTGIDIMPAPAGLTVSGGGTLTIEAEQNQGIQAYDVTVESGTLIIDANSHGINACGSGVTIKGGEVEITSAGYAAGTAIYTAGNPITIDPQDGAAITVEAGSDEDSAAEIDEYDENSGNIQSSVGSNTYFHSFVEGEPEPEPSITGVSITPDSATVEAGKTQQFSATVTGTGKYDESVTWSVTGGVSSTTISVDGLLTVAAGETAATLTVTATAKGDDTVSASVTVTVTQPEPGPSITSVSITPETVSVEAGKTQQFNATVSGTGSYESGVTWTVTGGVSAETTISTTGLLTVATGETAATLTVTATAKGDNTVSDSVTVTVTQPDEPDDPDEPDWPWYPGGVGTRYVTLSFEPRGGSEVKALRVPMGTTVDLREYSSERRGFDFAGWYPDETFDGSIDGLYMNRDRTVYAGWEPFLDVGSGDWFHGNVVYVYENGLMNGVSGALFVPDGTVTRGMIVTILHRLEGEPDASSAIPFADVESGAWYAEAVRWAASEGIVNGLSGTAFAPDDPITREQLAAILWRYAKYKGYDVSIGESTNILSYTDFDKVSEYAIPALQWACGEGVITGRSDGVLDPQGTATRAEAAAMLQRLAGSITK